MGLSSTLMAKTARRDCASDDGCRVIVFRSHGVRAYEGERRLHCRRRRCQFAAVRLARPGAELPGALRGTESLAVSSISRPVRRRLVYIYSRTHTVTAQLLRRRRRQRCNTCADLNFFLYL